MYETPSNSDLERNLSTISHAAHQRARDEVARLMSQLAARGVASSGVSVGEAITLLDAIHRDALNQSILILRDFAERKPLVPSEIVARLHLDNMGNSVLGRLPSVGLPDVSQQIPQSISACVSATPRLSDCT